MLQRTPKTELPPVSPRLERALKIGAVVFFIYMIAAFVFSFLRVTAAPTFDSAVV